jgi:opacity protein-like surface antigen
MIGKPMSDHPEPTAMPDEMIKQIAERFGGHTCAPHGYAHRSDFRSVRQGVDGSIRPRIGYLVNPWMMVYVTGGIAFNHVSGFL